jgi:hypothetical protein
MNNKSNNNKNTFSFYKKVYLSIFIFKSLNEKY